MCECSEKDWTGVDQTAEHHPDCRKWPPLEYESQKVFAGASSGILNDLSDAISRLESMPADKVIKFGYSHDPRSLEACQQRGFPGLTDDEVELETLVLQIIEANPECITRAVVKRLQQSTEDAQVLRQELSKGR